MSSTGPLLHGATGTPVASARYFACTLSPSLRIAAAGGPMKVTPIRSHNSTNPASSDTNPQPGQQASALAAIIARSSSA